MPSASDAVDAPISIRDRTQGPDCRARDVDTSDLSDGPGVKLGTPTLGDPIVTAGGLVFIGAAMDHYLRAFDVSNGDELWRGRLPAPAMATPMTYEWQGRQYVVIYSGGYARLDTTLSDKVIAFALP